VSTTTVKARDTHAVTWTINADLSSVVTVEAHVRLVDSATPITLAATITNPAAGEITHNLTGTLAAGRYYGEFELTATGGKISTAPTVGYFTLIVEADID